MDEDESDGPRVRRSVDSFRRAGSAASEGFGMLYEWSRAWFECRHSSIRFSIVVAVWFGGNWMYNRVAPTIVEITLALLRRISSELVLAPIFDALENRPVLASAQILLALLAFIVAQNRKHTRKLKNVEDKLTIMVDKPTRGSDGGTRELPPTGPRAIGGAIAGGAIGVSFGPGGLLAGILLGFIMGDKRDIRAYERDPHTPDLNARSQTEQ